MTTQRSTQNPDAGYNQRRARLHRVLDLRGPMRATDLAESLGWELREVSSKLQDLRRGGMADRDEQRSDRRLWWAT